MASTPGLAGIRFRAMGSDCHVLVLGGSDDDLAFAEDRVRQLESLWSRFQRNSEVSRLNSAGGAPMSVSAETMTLLCRGVRAQRLTGGWFDPFMGRDIVGLGYDQDFGSLTSVASRPGVTTHSLQPDSDGPRLVRTLPAAWLGVTLQPLTAQLPNGFDFDPGGIGKGLGADLVSLDLLGRGVAGALVNLGGDLRCRGQYPDDGWTVTIENPLDQGSALSEYVRLVTGSVATSTPLKRAWFDTEGRSRHHLVHPADGQPVDTEVASVSVIAPYGWLAEALCKAVLIAGPGVGRVLLEQHQAAGIVVTLDGSVLRM